MKKIMLILLILLLVTGCSKEKMHEHNFFYMDTYINVKLYNTEKYDEAFKKIDSIYKYYHELADRYNDTEGSVYYINNNNLEISEIELNKDICAILKLGMEYKEKTAGKFDINLAAVIDVWKKYRDNSSGIPSLEELETAKKNIKEITFTDECTIANNNPSIDLGALAKGYATEKVGEYLKEQGINQFLINAGGNVLVGDHYNNEKFKIGLETPDQKKDIYKVINANNVSVVTSGGYERFYTYNGVNYHHIIDPTTLFPTDKYKSVTVITKSSALADILSTSLFLLDIDSGKELIKDLDVEVVWYIDENNIITTEGIKKYE